MSSTLAHAGTVSIDNPQPGAKLYETLPLVIHIATEMPITSWAISAQSPEDDLVTVATGTAAHTGQVAVLHRDSFRAGRAYSLRLEVLYSNGALETAEGSFLVPASKYQTIPMEPGNHRDEFYVGMSIDSEGAIIAMNKGPVPVPHRPDNVELGIFHRLLGRWDYVSYPLASTRTLAVTRDGRRVYFNGSFPGERLSIGYVDVESLEVRQAVPGNEFFSVDRSGTRIAYQDRVRLLPKEPTTRQFFLFDSAAGTSVQLTADPETVVLTASPLACPRIGATTPLIDADGTKVVFFSSSTLGLAPEDALPACRVFSYTISPPRLDLIGTFSPEISIDFITLSDDGRRLSFIEFKPTADFRLFPFAGLLNLETKTLENLDTETPPYAVFDSVVTGDGKHVVISSQANLDPGVGNADHNLELFLYDIDTGVFDQISETTESVGSTPSGCDPYRPQTNATGSVVLFSYLVASGGGCDLDGPQRNEPNGFYFRRVRAVKKRAGNRPPTIVSPTTGLVLARAGETLDFDVAAVDEDGDPITWFFQLEGTDDVPLGAVADDHHNGSATLRWVTSPGQVGHYNIRIAAFDEGGGEVIATLQVQLCSQSPPLNMRDGIIGEIFGFANECFVGDFNGDSKATAADLVATLPTAEPR